MSTNSSQNVNTVLLQFSPRNINSSQQTDLNITLNLIQGQLQCIIILWNDNNVVHMTMFISITITNTYVYFINLTCITYPYYIAVNLVR